MRRIIFISLVLMACSCGVSLPVVVKDSVRVEYRERIVYDTVEVVIPMEVEKVVTKDTVSHLENLYAESDAVVSGGLLTHSLRSFPKVIRVPVEVLVHDTTYVEISREKEVVEVERSVSDGEHFWMTLGKMFLGLLLSVILFVVLKLVMKW